MKISIEIEIELEHHNREQFQKEGHMLFGLYGPGDKPDDPPIRRSWEGGEVWIAKHHANNTELRVMSDTQERTIDGMKEMLINTLYASARQSKVQEFDYQQFLSLNNGRNELQNFIHSNYAWEIANTPARDVFHFAMHYLMRERKRWWVRFCSLFRKAPQQSLWVDPAATIEKMKGEKE